MKTNEEPAKTKEDENQAIGGNPLSVSLDMNVQALPVLSPLEDNSPHLSAIIKKETTDATKQEKVPVINFFKMTEPKNLNVINEENTHSGASQVLSAHKNAPSYKLKVSKSKKKSKEKNNKQLVTETLKSEEIDIMIEDIDET